MKKILIYLGVLFAFMGVGAYLLVRPLLASPLHDACRALRPGMDKTEAIEAIEARHNKGFFWCFGNDPGIQTPHMESVVWLNFRLDPMASSPYAFNTPDILPVSLHYRNDEVLETYFCDGKVCENTGTTKYHRSTSLVMTIDIKNQYYREFTLYEIYGDYPLEDGCDPKP